MFKSLVPEKYVEKIAIDAVDMSDRYLLDNEEHRDILLMVYTRPQCSAVASFQAVSIPGGRFGPKNAAKRDRVKGVVSGARMLVA